VLSPQCPEGEYWTDTDALIALLDEVENKYQIDPTRVYLTGHSMGGFGTWYLAYKHLERFAAIAPMSAPFTVTAWAARLKDIPIWAFHGTKDSLVRLWPEARPDIVGATAKQQIEALAMRGHDCIPARGGPIGRGPVAVGEIAVLAGDLDHAVQRDVFDDLDLSHGALIF
jgi:poly(3-hydroxybutyrate) depolymerase